EAIDLAIRGGLAALQPDRRKLTTTAIEHAAIRELSAELGRLGAPVRMLALNPTGEVDVGRASEADCSGMVSVQWANNETGAVQPVRELAAAVRAGGGVFHCDATQWIGKEPAEDATEWADLLTFAPHKFGGPMGVGVLWARPGVRLSPRLLGTQELGRRGGTENVPGIVGAGVAALEVVEWLADAGGREHGCALRDRFEQLVRAGVPDVVVNGAGAARLWNTSNLGFPRLEAEALLMLLSERGVFASAGAACSSGSLEPSPVLLAMGVPPEVAHGSLRFSLGRSTTAQEVEAAASGVVEAVKRLGGASSVLNRG
ncbi:MAG: aminotransferase class V-fold PLP-dependent enzyme, partial [bacterium]|nr:aminotransferase class V-fold PLP-dependent enzyme [bacterium]